MSSADKPRDEERKYNKHTHGGSSRSRKSGKGSSSRWKDGNHSTRSDSTNTLQDHGPSCQVSPKESRNKLRDNFEIRYNENGSRYISDQESAKIWSCGNGKRKSQSNLRVFKGCDSKESAKLNTPQETDVKHSPKGIKVKKCDEDLVVIVSKKAKLLTIPPSGRTQSQMLASESVSGNHKVNEAHISTNNASQVADHFIKESTSTAATISLKEATDLKHMADRLKNSGANLESTWLYFQATLKFLVAASQLESSSANSTNEGDMARSMTVYRSTATLCKFCAREYERVADMAAAALAYKLMEVAYMRVAYSSQSTAKRYQHELHMAVQMARPEPSPSASNVDHLKDPTFGKAASTKGTCSPQVVGNQVISAPDPSYLKWLLTFTQDVNFAMEASRKSRAAFAAASGHMDILSIKRVLDFNFLDLEGLLVLVRLAIDAINPV